MTRGSIEMNPAQIELAQQLDIDNIIEHDYWGTAPYLIDDQYHMYVGAGKLKSALLQNLNVTITQRLRSITLVDTIQAPSDSHRLFSIPQKNRLSSIQGLDNLDTSVVTNMSGMFRDDDELEEVVGLEEWDTRQVMNMYHMFYRTYIAGLDLSHWDTHNLKDIRGMFQECKIKSLDLTGWDVHRITDFDDIFNGANFLKHIAGLQDWDTSQATSMQRTFAHTNLLQSLDIHHWNVTFVRDFQDMFYSCGLPYLDLSDWNVANARNLERMFGVMNKLEEIKLTHWRLSQAKITDQMFVNDQRLTHILINDWSIPRTASKQLMFHMCNNLKKR